MKKMLKKLTEKELFNICAKYHDNCKNCPLAIKLDENSIICLRTMLNTEVEVVKK